MVACKNIFIKHLDVVCWVQRHCITFLLSSANAFYVCRRRPGACKLCHWQIELGMSQSEWVIQVWIACWSDLWLLVKSLSAKMPMISWRSVSCSTLAMALSLGHETAGYNSHDAPRASQRRAPTIVLWTSSFDFLPMINVAGKIV